MTHPQLKPVLLVGLLLAFALPSGSASAQEPQPAKDDKEAADAALRSKAFDLLETVAGQIGTLQSGENRARLGSNLAASLWKQNEQRARGLLVAVQNDINAGLQKNDEDDESNTQTLMVFLKLRMDTAERISKLDANAAYFAWCDFDRAVSMSAQFERPEIRLMAQLKLAQSILAGPPKRLTWNAYIGFH